MVVVVDDERNILACSHPSHVFLAYGLQGSRLIVCQCQRITGNMHIPDDYRTNGSFFYFCINVENHNAEEQV